MCTEIYAQELTPLLLHTFSKQPSDVVSHRLEEDSDPNGILSLSEDLAFFQQLV